MRKKAGRGAVEGARAAVGEGVVEVEQEEVALGRRWGTSRHHRRNYNLSWCADCSRPDEPSSDRRCSGTMLPRICCDHRRHKAREWDRDSGTAPRAAGGG